MGVQMVTVSTRVETFLVVFSQPAVQLQPPLSATTRPSVSQLYSFSLLCLQLLDLQSANCTASAYFVCKYKTFSQPAEQHLPTLSVTTRPSVSQLYSISLLCLSLLDLQSSSCTASAYFVCNY